MERARRLPWVVFSLAALAFLFRVFNLGKQSIWMDEAFSLWIASQPLALLPAIIRYDAHPPLFYALLHFWRLGGNGEAYLRLPSAFFGVLNTLAFFLLGQRLLGTPKGVAAGAFWAVSFLALQHETQVRMYPMAAFFSILATFCFWTWRETQKGLIPYLLLAALSLYTHYYTGFVLLGHFLFLAYEKRWRDLLTAGMILALLLVPWLPALLGQMRHGAGQLLSTTSWLEYFQGFGWMIFTQRFFRSDSLRSPFGALLSLVSLLVAAWGAVQLLRRAPEKGMFLVLLLGCAALLPFLMNAATRWHIFIYRYVILFAPYFFLLFLYGLLQLPRAVSAGGLAAVLFVNASVWLFFVTGPAFERQNWRAASGMIRRHLAPGDLLVAEQGMGIFPLWYYLPDRLSIRWNGAEVITENPPQAPPVYWFTVSEESALPPVINALKQSRRQWLVLCQWGMADPDHRLLSWLKQNRKAVLHYFFRSIDHGNEIYLFLFEPSPRGVQRNTKAGGMFRGTKLNF